MNQAQQKHEPSFRFLTDEEFKALTQDQKIEYLRRAVQAIRDGHPLDGVPLPEYR